MSNLQINDNSVTHNFMEQNTSCIANSCSDSQEIPRHISANPVHTLKPYFLTNHFNISSHLRIGLPKGLFIQGLRQKFVRISHHSHACYIPRTSHPP
jgi:hypothetical protein